MYRIMFVCHGNICRSPMAEFVFKDMVKKAGREDEFCIRSAATSTEELGNPVYPPAKAELAAHGLSCKGKTAVRLSASDYDKYDYFICMDSANIRNASKLLSGDPDEKIRRMLPDKDVSDPWYTDRFDIAYNDIVRGCTMLLDELKD